MLSLFRSPFGKIQVTGLCNQLIRLSQTLVSVNGSIQHRKGSTSRPERPLAPFLQYVRDRQEEIEKDLGGAEWWEICQHGAKFWNNESKEVQDKYKAEFRTKFIEHREAYEVYLRKITPEQIKVEESKRRKTRANALRKDKVKLGRPSRPKGAHYIYIMETLDERKKQGQKRTKNSFVEVLEEWKMLPEKEKEKYHEKSLRQIEQYQEDLKVWERKMIEIGRYDVLRQKSFRDLVTTGKVPELEEER